jgi:hypothetical protein
MHGRTSLATFVMTHLKCPDNCGSLRCGLRRPAEGATDSPAVPRFCPPGHARRPVASL